jgi:hypothetical protein
MAPPNLHTKLHTVTFIFMCFYCFWCINTRGKRVAVREGFEPSVVFSGPSFSNML